MVLRSLLKMTSVGMSGTYSYHCLLNLTNCYSPKHKRHTKFKSSLP